LDLRRSAVTADEGRVRVPAYLPWALVLTSWASALGAVAFRAGVYDDSCNVIDSFWQTLTVGAASVAALTYAAAGITALGAALDGQRAKALLPLVVVMLSLLPLGFALLLAVFPCDNS
jgi:hypothetical protein